MKSDCCSVLIIHNVIAPYRLPLFDSLSDHVDLHVFFCEASRSDREWEAEVDQYDFAYTVGRPYRIGPLRFNPELQALFRENDFDVCIVGENTSTAPASLFVALLSQTTDTKFVLWSEVREPGSPYLELESPWRTALRRVIGIYRKVLYRFADSFLALSTDAEQYLRSYGVTKDRIDTGPQVMPVSLLPECEAFGGNESFRILYLGYLRERKGVHHLINAYRRIRARKDDVELIIGGSGPYEERLKEVAEGVPDVQFVGYVPEERKACWYRSADLFVLPTLHDAWGLVVNEALYYGVPVVTTDEAASRELVERTDTGIIVPAGDPDALADTINSLISNPTRLRLLERQTETASEAWQPETGIAPFLDSLSRYCSGVDSVSQIE